MFIVFTNVFFFEVQGDRAESRIQLPFQMPLGEKLTRSLVRRRGPIEDEEQSSDIEDTERAELTLSSSR